MPQCHIVVWGHEDINIYIKKKKKLFLPSKSLYSVYF